MESIDYNKKLVIYSSDDIENSDEVIVINFSLLRPFTYKQIENEIDKSYLFCDDYDCCYKFLIFDVDEILVAGKFYFYTNNIYNVTHENVEGQYTEDNIDDICWDDL